MTEKIIKKTKGLARAEFNFWVGKYQDKMYDAFENKKLIGNKCPKCSDVFFPPRKICGKCNEVIPLEKNWIDLPETGTLINYTRTPYKVNDRGSRNIKKLQDIGLVRIDGTNTAIIYKLFKMEPEDLKIGLKVKVEWANKLKGHPADIKGFVKA